MLTDVVIVAAVLFLRFFVLSVCRIKGRSMQPTLRDREWTLVMRRPCLYRTIRRNDVVICHYPGRWWRGVKGIPQCFVKRVIGLPGETLEIVACVVHIDGTPLGESFLDPQHSRIPRNRPPVTLGPEEYFVMGDNRDSSHDSRSPAVGPLRRRAIVGRVVCTLWPVGTLRRIR